MNHEQKEIAWHLSNWLYWADPMREAKADINCDDFYCNNFYHHDYDDEPVVMAALLVLIDLLE